MALRPGQPTFSVFDDAAFYDRGGNASDDLYVEGEDGALRFHDAALYACAPSAGCAPGPQLHHPRARASAVTTRA